MTAERLATRNLGERVAVRMQGTGEALGVPASEDDLRFRFDQERFVQSVNQDNAQVDAEAGRQEQRGQFDEAAENISPTHVLGWQWDGRSAKQQLEAAQEQEKGQREVDDVALAQSYRKSSRGYWLAYLPIPIWP